MNIKPPKDTKSRKNTKPLRKKVMHEGEEVELRRCSKCKVYKRLSAFYRNRSTSDGLAKECKTCDRFRRKSQSGLGDKDL